MRIQSLYGVKLFNGYLQQIVSPIVKSGDADIIYTNDGLNKILNSIVKKFYKRRWARSVITYNNPDSTESNVKSNNACVILNMAE